MASLTEYCAPPCENQFAKLGLIGVTVRVEGVGLLVLLLFDRSAPTRLGGVTTVLSRTVPSSVMVLNLDSEGVGLM